MNLQVEILSHIRCSRIDPGAFPQELSEILSISIDSTYRRLRGDTEITLDELSKLCNHYNFSIDSFVNKNLGKVIFSDRWMPCKEFSYTNYLRNIRNELNSLVAFADAQIFYSAKDIPIFYNLLIDEISAFKGFFWEKSVAQVPELKKKKFSVKTLSPDDQVLCKEIVRLFNATKSSELWNDEVLTSTMKQIKFYYESGFFESTEDIAVLIYQLERLIDHLEQQADSGLKSIIDDKPDENSNQFLLYYSDVLMGDNTVMVDRGGSKGVFKAHNIIDDIFSDDERFCQRAWEMHEKFLNSATLISGVSQRDRTRFFNRLRKKIAVLKREIL